MVSIAALNRYFDNMQIFPAYLNMHYLFFKRRDLATTHLATCVLTSRFINVFLKSRQPKLDYT